MEFACDIPPAIVQENVYVLARFLMDYSLFVASWF